MPTLSRATRLLGYLLVGAGIVRLAISLATDEGVNTHGFVPGVLIGFVIAALGGVALSAASRIGRRQYGWLAADVGLMLWLAASTYLFLSVPPGSLAQVPMGAIIGVLVVLGVLCTLIAALMVLVILPFSSVLAWLLDRIPTLRRHRIGTEIRRQIRGKR